MRLKARRNKSKRSLNEVCSMRSKIIRRVICLRNFLNDLLFAFHTINRRLYRAHFLPFGPITLNRYKEHVFLLLFSQQSQLCVCFIIESFVSNAHLTEIGFFRFKRM